VWVATTSFISALAVMTALALPFGGGPISFVMLVLRDVFWTLMLMAFWDLAGYLLDLQQAKRLFGLIGGGEVAGGIAAGLLVGPLVGALGVPAVVWIAAGGYLACVGLLLTLLRRRPPASAADEAGDRERSAIGIWSMLRDRYVLLLVMVPVAYTLTYDFLEYAYMSQVGSRYAQDKAALAAFLGSVLAAAEAVTLIVRTLLSGRVLMRFGLWVALAVPPALLCLGGAGILAACLAGVTHLFWPVVALKLSDSVIRNSLHKPSFLVLFQVLRRDLRVRVHAFQEAISEPVASGVSGVILLAATAFLGGLPTTAKVAGAAGLVLVFASCRLTLIAKLRPTYDVMLARALSRRTLVPTTALTRERGTTDFLRSKLASQTAGEVIYSLRVLQPLLRDAEIAGPLEALLDHDDPDVRLEACRQAESRHVASLRASLERRLGREPVPDVVGAILRALAALAAGEAIDVLVPRLDVREPAIRSGALVGLLKHGGIPGVLTAGERLLHLLASADAADRVFAAGILGEVAIRDYYQPLLRLLDDPSPDVRRAALAAAANVRSPRLLPRIVKALSQPGLSALARHALVAMGREAVPALDVALAECGTRSVAASIAQVLGKIDAAEATDALLARLDHPEPEVRREVIHALRRRPLAPDAVRTEALLAWFRREVDGAALVDAALADLERCPEAQELVRTLQHQLERQLEMTLGLLVLVHPRSNLPLVEHHLGSDSATKRAYAIEIIDRTCTWEVACLIHPLIEDIPVAERRARLAGSSPVSAMGPVLRLREVIGGRAPWITTWMRVGALYAAGCLGEQTLADDARGCLDDPDPHVRETAQWVAGRMTSDGNNRGAVA
jgi:HEAT repeat protein